MGFTLSPPPKFVLAETAGWIRSLSCTLSLQSFWNIAEPLGSIEHSKLEFTLTLKIRRDAHIISQFKAIAPAPHPLPPPVIAASSKGGMRSFFSHSPKKSKDKIQQPPPQVQPAQPLPENLARYLKPDGTLARAFISFKDISSRCDTRLFETNYPLIGQKIEAGGKMTSLQIGELVLQLFRLPPLPGISQDQLPQSLEECHRGLRHLNWHKVTYFEGTLTQNGGDCMVRSIFLQRLFPSEFPSVVAPSATARDWLKSSRF